MHVKLLQKKWICCKCVARKFGFVYLRFDPFVETVIYLDYIRYSQFTRWCRGIAVALGTRDHGLIPCSGKGFYVWYFVLFLMLCFYLFVQNPIICDIFCNLFYNLCLFTIPNILQDVWPIIRVWINRPSIFKIYYTSQQKKILFRF